MEFVDDLAMPFLLTTAFRALVDAVHEQLAAAGFPDVRATHGFAMQAIGTGCTSVELAQRLGVSKQAASKTAQSLVDMGLVVRAASSRDGREKVLTPTAAGERMLDLSAEAFRSEIRTWRERVGDQAIDCVLSTLAQVPGGAGVRTDISHWR